MFVQERVRPVICGETIPGVHEIHGVQPRPQRDWTRAIQERHEYEERRRRTEQPHTQFPRYRSDVTKKCE